MVISDEPYEDIVYDGARHVSLAALPEMHERTVSVFTFSKSHVMTGLRLGYVVVKNQELRARVLKLISLTASNVSSVIQHGGLADLGGTLTGRHRRARSSPFCGSTPPGSPRADWRPVGHNHGRWRST